jgi:hypothetical protein
MVGLLLLLLCPVKLAASSSSSSWPAPWPAPWASALLQVVLLQHACSA